MCKRQNTCYTGTIPRELGGVFLYMMNTETSLQTTTVVTLRPYPFNGIRKLPEQDHERLRCCVKQFPPVTAAVIANGSRFHHTAQLITAGVNLRLTSTDRLAGFDLPSTTTAWNDALRRLGHNRLNNPICINDLMEHSEGIDKIIAALRGTIEQLVADNRNYLGERKTLLIVCELPFELLAENAHSLKLEQPLTMVRHSIVLQGNRAQLVHSSLVQSSAVAR